MQHDGYFAYIEQHRENVKKAWYHVLRPAIESDSKYKDAVDSLDVLIESHDVSKYDPNEFHRYDAYFYKGLSAEESEIDLGWLHHQNSNRHHWQYWVIIPDDSDMDDSNTIRPLDMPLECICEMLCDWHSFSNRNPSSTAYSWYTSRKHHMILSQNTREVIEELLPYFKQPLGGV